MFLLLLLRREPGTQQGIGEAFILPGLLNLHNHIISSVAFRGITEDDAIAPMIEAANASLSASLQGPLMQKVGKTIMAQGLETPIEFEPSIVAYNKSVVGGNVVAPIGQCRSELAGIYIKK